MRRRQTEPDDGSIYLPEAHGQLRLGSSASLASLRFRFDVTYPGVHEDLAALNRSCAALLSPKRTCATQSGWDVIAT
jgi:hypothetical protein